MDTELIFIASLLRASRNEQRKYFALDMPLGVFERRDSEMNWICTFYRKHHECPSVEAFNQRFPEVTLGKPKLSVLAALDPVLDNARFSQIRTLTESVRKRIDKGDPISQILSFFKASALRLTDFSTQTSDLNYGTSHGTDRRYRETVRMLQKKSGVATSPWPTLNKHFPFAKGGDRITIAGRGGLGKTWALLAWGSHWADMGIRTGIFSKEMPVDDVEDRLDCIRYGLNYPDLISGTLAPKTLRDFRERKHEDSKKDTNLYLFGNTQETILTLDVVMTKIREYALDAVWVDGIYLIRPHELQSNISDTQRFTYLSNRSKEIATSSNVIFGATIQDNRSAEDKNGTSRGGATTAHGADAWYQDSDLMAHLGGNRTDPHRELVFSKIRKAPLFDMAISFELSPPKFADKGVPLSKPADAVRAIRAGKAPAFKSKKP